MGPPWAWALPLLPLPQSWMRLGLGLPIFRERHGRDRGSERNSQSMVLYIWNPTPDLVAVLDANFLTHRELMPCGCGCNNWLIQPWIHSLNTSTIRWLRCLMRTFTLPSIAKCNCWMCENLIFTLNSILPWNVLDAIYCAHSTRKLGKVWVLAICMCHGTLSGTCFLFHWGQRSFSGRLSGPFLVRQLPGRRLSCVIHTPGVRKHPWNL